MKGVATDDVGGGAVLLAGLLHGLVGPVPKRGG